MEAITSSLDITPSTPLPTACHEEFDIPSDSLAFRFEANIAAFRDNGLTVVLLSLDWFYSSPTLRARILARCAGLLDESNLFVAASHSHTSPSTDATKVGFSKVDEAYVSSVEDAIADRVHSLLRAGDWRTVRLRFTAASCDCAVHRRRVVWRPEGRRLRRAVSFYPNPEGPRDRELRLLRVEDVAGGLLAVIWGASCHPTEWPRSRELSSDYPGGVRNALRSHIGGEVPILFLQGFAGDLRPPAFGHWSRRGSWIKRLLLLGSSFVNGPCFTGFSPEEYQRWLAGIATAACGAVDEAAKSPEMTTRLAVRRSSMPLGDVGITCDIPALTCHSVELAESLRIVGLSAEVCWEYIGLVQRAFPGQTVWPVGYIDDVFGYLPTNTLVSEGGYEVTGFLPAFGVEGRFTADLEQRIAALLAATT